MDMRKIGAFLKALRREKGLTQEQLAERMLVSGKTVSRWETGTNLPDLSILMELAEFYGVEIKEILDGERKGELMGGDLRETLNKVADYSKMEKEKAARIGQTAFAVTFAACAAALLAQLAQLAAGVGWREVLGENVTLLTGGVAYLGMMLRSGLGEPGSTVKERLIGLLCSIGVTVVFVLRSIRLGAPPERLAPMAILFFAGITLLGFGLMKALARLNGKRKKPD